MSFLQKFSFFSLLLTLTHSGIDIQPSSNGCPFERYGHKITPWETVLVRNKGWNTEQLIFILFMAFIDRWTCCVPTKTMYLHLFHIFRLVWSYYRWLSTDKHHFCCQITKSHVFPGERAYMLIQLAYQYYQCSMRQVNSVFCRSKSLERCITLNATNHRLRSWVVLWRYYLLVHAYLYLPRFRWPSREIGIPSFQISFITRRLSYLSQHPKFWMQ